VIHSFPPIPPDGESSRPSPAVGEKAGSLMQHVNREWNCRNCGRSNRSEVALNGTVKCEHCASEMRIQPSRARGGETPGQPTRSEARTPGAQETR